MYGVCVGVVRCPRDLVRETLEVFQGFRSCKRCVFHTLTCSPPTRYHERFLVNLPECVTGALGGPLFQLRVAFGLDSKDDRTVFKIARDILDTLLVPAV